MKYNCEDIGFEHLWEDIIPIDGIFPTTPPFPPPERKCVNCGKRERLVIIQQDIKEWQEIK